MPGRLSGSSEGLVGRGPAAGLVHKGHRNCVPVAPRLPEDAGKVALLFGSCLSCRAPGLRPALGLVAKVRGAALRAASAQAQKPPPPAWGRGFLGALRAATRVAARAPGLLRRGPRALPQP